MERIPIDLTDKEDLKTRIGIICNAEELFKDIYKSMEELKSRIEDLERLATLDSK